MPPSPLARLRKICLALPEAHEVEAWGEPTFRVRNKLFAMYANADNHHGGGTPAVWCKAAPGNQAVMIQADPKRFFVPPYVGPSGWIGIRLGPGADWPEVAELMRDAYRLVAPKKLHAELDAPAPRKQTRKPTRTLTRKAARKPATKARRSAR